jgi:hypothetical protein
MKGAILFYGFHLLQSIWLLSLHPAQSSCAPLLRFGSLQRLRSKECFFPGLPYLARYAPRFSQPFSVSSLRLSGFFHPVALLGFFLQSILLQEIGFLFRGSLPSCRWLLRVYLFAIFVWLRIIHYEFAVWLQGLYSLLKLVLIDLVVSLFYGRCSLGFHSSSGGSYSLSCALPA